MGEFCTSTFSAMDHIRIDSKGSKMKRRDFLKTSSAIGISSLISTSCSKSDIENKTHKTKSKPIVIASANGIHSVQKAYELIQNKSGALDAVIAGVNLVEDDPTDHSVGLGGLPNSEGVVELDSCCMHGPTHNAGAVAAIQNIRNPSKVAKLVMEKTNHVLLMGKGALQFAKANGLKEENLLTEEAQKKWLEWKNESENNISNLKTIQYKHHGTINCNAIDLNGNISGVTTTSGLAFKLPGRVGDSPIVGAGLYVDNEIGACGSTGLGELNLKNLSSFMVVEYMNMGKSPEEACLKMCKRILNHQKNSNVFSNDNLPDFNVSFYAINKYGEYGSASINGPVEFSICDQNGARLEKGTYLFKK